MNIWDSLPKKQYLSLAPWAWVQLESAEPPGPFPFIAGVAPEVVASLHEAHGLLSSAIDTAISDVFSKRAPPVLICNSTFVADGSRMARFNGSFQPTLQSLPSSPTAGYGFFIL
jgi:hypothetical protein